MVENVAQTEQIEYLYGIVHSYTVFFLICDVLIFVAGAVVVSLLIKFLKSKQALRNSGEYLRNTIHGQEEERARIARELHDTVAQDLRYCRNLTDKISDDGLRQSLSEILDKSIGEVRNISYNLAPPDITKNDLRANIMNLCRTFGDFSGIEIRLAIPDGLDTKFLTHEDNLNIYRIVQESLTNIEKHAEASEVTVLLRNQTSSEEKGLYVFITDDGVGFDSWRNYASGMRHFGLEGMKQRAALIGAKLEFNSMRGEGTQISLVKKMKSKPA